MDEKKQMRRLAALLFLMTCFLSSHSVENNLTMAEVPVEVPITSDDDSEQELSSQLQEVDSRTGGWSAWSEWSACSRSCDGGVSHQLRTCRAGSCRGEHVRYKICNMQCILVFVGIVAAAHGSLIGPAGIIAPGIAAPLGVTSQAAAQLALQLSVPAGSGLEGQWIPDINEKLYDDGAYRPLIHGL